MQTMLNDIGNILTAVGEHLNKHAVELWRMALVFAIGYAIYKGLDWLADRQAMQKLREDKAKQTGGDNSEQQ